MYCHLHKNQGPKKVEVWKLETNDTGDKNQDSAKGDLVSTTAPYQSAVDSDLCELSTPMPWNLRYPSPAEFRPELYDTTPFNILARVNHLEDQELSFFGVQKQLQAPLRKDDRGEGFVYAYEVEGNKGFVKIGYTTRSINECHDEWSFHCNRLTKLIYPPVLKVNTAVPNAASVEKLCYAKLNTGIHGSTVVNALSCTSNGLRCHLPR
ncbi:hypothetical protein BDV24DRAFT_162845 [Aspergillus arachidicola]|uniref:Bacteriophage T5 Orf172 DNA-binding domain-containing protein n=1 Tax=Aspergillus arachidicola TaxID=656916 RepID=A0A5N6Y8Z9_9EURO|nr:hypothetical protein BDV24DRAFT_162845 [Aspergillus arachidicola]